MMALVPVLTVMDEGTQVIEALKSHPRMGKVLEAPSISYGTANLYMRGATPLKPSVSNLHRSLQAAPAVPT